MSVQALESLLASDNLEQVSARVKIAADIELPELKCWNYAPCRKHRRWETPEGVVRQNVPKPGCRDCGLHPRKHQRVGATWLYLQKKALLADSCGTGKTAHLGLLIAMMQETLEIHSQARVVLVCRSAAVYQHVAELRRMLPMAHVAAAVGAKRKRMETYVSGWDVLVIGQHMFLRDVDILMQFSLALLAIDDVDALRTRSSKTAWAIKRVAARTPRCVVMTGTPLQKKLHELYSVLEPLGGRTVFGSEAAFMRRYVKTENMVVWTNTGRRMTIPKVVGYQHLAQPLDAAVLTPVGWTEMGALNVGDAVVAPEGTCHVLGVYPRGLQEVFRVEFSDGTFAEATGDHLWLVRSSKHPHRGWQTLALSEIVQRSAHEGQKYAVYPMSGEAFLGSLYSSELSPYVLGALLGDGSVKGGSPQLTSPDLEIFQMVEDECPAGVSLAGFRSVDGPNMPVYSGYFTANVGAVGFCVLCGSQRGRFVRNLCLPCYREVTATGALPQFPQLENPLTKALRTEGVWGLGAHEKFVPEHWLRASIDQRHALLQGLLDTDGHCSKTGRVIFVSVSEQLVRDVASLARSLGGKASVRFYESQNAPWRCELTLPSLFPPFRLSKKSDRVKDQRQNRALQKFIVGVESVGLKEVQCIRVSAASQCYVTDGFTVTHNTEVQDLIQPFALRRTAADIEDVDLPAVISSNVYLELTPAQRSRYDELKEGVIQIVSDEGVQVKQATALSKIHYGAKICTGLAALGEEDTPGTSVKLDWVMDKVGPDGDLGSEKVVIFLGYKTSIRALQARLDAVGVGYVTIWGDEPDKAKRAEAIEKFWTDPSCRVLLGTQAIEQSLNLQVANHLINVDMILNPARMEQLAGRIRRDGSAHTSVYVHNLLTLDTQEERYIPLLEREQALIDTVWDESSELFESLSPLALLTLISG